MNKIIAIANQKGGVGKTTTTINLGAYLSFLGKSSLIVDIDPQGNAGSGLGLNINKIKNNIYSALSEESLLNDFIHPTGIDGLSIAPSNIDLSGLEVDLQENKSRDKVLKNSIKELLPHYDYILIDCPPSLGVLTINALVAADQVLIPLQCEYFALEGLTQLLRIIKFVQTKMNTELSINGVLLTMFDSRTKLSGSVVADVREHFKEKVYDVIIPRNIKLSEAPSYGEPISVYDPRSSGAVAYKALALEFVERTNGIS